jgi:hypothetical protein
LIIHDKNWCCFYFRIFVHELISSSQSESYCYPLYCSFTIIFFRKPWHLSHVIGIPSSIDNVSYVQTSPMVNYERYIWNITGLMHLKIFKNYWIWKKNVPSSLYSISESLPIVIHVYGATVGEI